jgi:integrase
MGQAVGWAEQLPNGTWRACWRDDLQKRHSVTRDPSTHKPFTREAHALRIANSKEDKARRGEASDDGRAPTWSKWADTWLAARRVEASTAQQDAVRIERYLRPKWGARRLNTITRTQVQAWVNELGETTAKIPVPVKPPEGWTPPEPRTLSPSTIDKIYRLFSASMKAATLDEHVPLTVTPCRGINLPTISKGHERYFTRAEVDAIAFHLNEPWRSAVLMLAGTGMRFGELAGLHWQRVDMAEGVIHVVETWDEAAGEIKPYPKSRKPRAVPIPSWLTSILEDLLDRQGVEAGTCGLKHGHGGPRCRSRLVLPAPHGGAMNVRNFGRREFANAVALAGLGDARVHDLRHSYASWLVQAGVALPEVQRLLGHSSILTTQRYAHFGTSQYDRVLAALG